MILSAAKLGTVAAWTGARWVVDLREKKCFCGEFQERSMPCRHALVLIREQQRERETYVSKIYTIVEHRETDCGGG